MENFEQTLDYIHRVQRAPTPNQVCSELLTAVSAFGFSAVIAGTLPRAEACTRELKQRVLLQGWPEEWLKVYLEKDFVKRDPVIQFMKARQAPFRWSEIKSCPEIYARGADVLQTARDFGLHDGFAFAMRMLDGTPVMVTFGGGNVDISEEGLSQLWLLATYALGKALQLSVPYRSSDCKLTAREIECIRWASVGKSEWEISQILGISEHTSEKHLLNAKAKLGASNRTHAVAEAMRLGFVG